jgi:hypothetical protein
MHRLLIALTAAVAMLLGSAGTAAADPGTARAVSRFNIEVQTGWQNWAGTDATVHAKVYGCDDTSGPFVNLDSSADDFEPGSFRRYGYWNWDLNGVCQLAIVKYANGSDWQVDYANVVDGVTGAIYRCLAADGSGGYFPDEKQWKYFWCYRI